MPKSASIHGPADTSINGGDTVTATANPGPGSASQSVDLGILSDTTGFLVRRLHNRLAATWAEDFADAPVALTQVQAGLLTLIGNNPGITQRGLVQVMDVEPASLVASIKRLAKIGLITKTPSVSDGRARELRPTSKGREIIAHIERAMVSRQQRLAMSIAPGDFIGFMTVLKHLSGMV